jgi:hypothetical protein
MPRDKITVVETRLSLEELSGALRISVDDAMAKFREPA